MFAKHDTPAQIEAGIKWHQLREPDARHRPVQLRPAEGGRLPRRLPRARAVHRARPATRSTSSAPQSATINTAYYKPFVKAQENGDGEPTDAQAVYKTLDPVMLAVLTEPNADIPTLLKTAATNVNTILANAGVSGESRNRSDVPIRNPIRARGGRRPQPPAPRPALTAALHPPTAPPADPRQEMRMADVATRRAPRPHGSRRLRRRPAGGCCQGPAQRRGLGIPDRRGALLLLLLLVPDRPRSHHELPEAGVRRRLHLGGLRRTTSGSSTTRRSGRPGGTPSSSPCSRWSSGTRCPFVVAIVLNELRHARGYLRVLVYLPVMLPPASALLLFAYFYNPQYGLFDDILRTLHLPTSQWVLQPGDGFISTAMVVRGDRVDLDEHGQRDADLPGRAAEHPRRAVRGGRARGGGHLPPDQARDDPADQADPGHCC